MSYTVHLSKSAQKAYAKLPSKLRDGINRCIEQLKVNPRYNPNPKALKGQPGAYRYQVGGWRILYEVDEELKQVRVYEIGPRGDVYKH